MTARPLSAFVQYFQQAKFMFLLIMLVGMFVLHNLGGMLAKGTIEFTLAYLFLLFLAVMALSLHSIHMMVVAALIGLAGAFFTLMTWVQTDVVWVICSDFADLVFLTFVAIVLLIAVVRAPRVTRDTLLGAICIYLLMGGAWAFAYALVERFWPGSYRFAYPFATSAQVTDAADILVREYRQYFYFSFITLCTIGYGDMTPASQPARSLAILEAVFGQCYMAIMIGRLVSLNIAEQLNKRTE
jgi:hypothetical protein